MTMVRFSPSTLKYMGIMLSLFCLGSTSYTSSPESDDMLDTDHKGKPGKRKRTDMSTVQKNQTTKRSRTDSTTAEQQQETLLETLTSIAASNIKAFDEADIDQLKKNHERFDNTLSWTDQDWKAAFTNPRTWLPTTDEPQQENINSHTNCFAHAYATTIYQWPGVGEHDYKSAILAHLFFPPRTNELLSSEYTKDRLMRGDYLYGFLTAARYGHTIAHYHLIYNLQKARQPFLEAAHNRDEEIAPSFFAEQFKKIEKALSKCKNNADVHYIIGRNYQYDTIFTNMFTSNPKKALEFFNNSTEPRHKLEIMNIENYKCSDHQKAFNDYYKLAQETKYGPAYLKTISKLNDLISQSAQDDKQRSALRKRKQEILTEAIDEGYIPALIERGRLSYLNKDEEAALEDFREAGEKGVSYGYLMCATVKSHLFDQAYSYPLKFQLNRISSEAREQIKDNYRLAGQHNDLHGWSNLIGFSLVLAKDKFDETLYQDLEKGLRVDSPSAYLLAEKEEKFKNQHRNSQHGKTAFIYKYELFKKELDQ